MVHRISRCRSLHYDTNAAIHVRRAEEETGASSMLRMLRKLFPPFRCPLLFRYHGYHVQVYVHQEHLTEGKFQRWTLQKKHSFLVPFYSIPSCLLAVSPVTKDLPKRKKSTPFSISSWSLRDGWKIHSNRPINSSRHRRRRPSSEFPVEILLMVPLALC